MNYLFPLAVLIFCGALEMYCGFFSKPFLFLKKLITGERFERGSA